MKCLTNNNNNSTESKFKRTIDIVTAVVRISKKISTLVTLHK